MPLDPDTAQQQREANNVERIKHETAWGRRGAAGVPQEMVSRWEPCVPSSAVADDLSIPDYATDRLIGVYDTVDLGVAAILAMESE